MARGSEALAATRLACAVVALVSITACGASVGDSGSQTPAPRSPSVSSASAAVNASPTGSASFCAILPTAAVSDLVGQAMVSLPSASNERVCTFRAVETEQTLDVAFRLEDTFEDLDKVRDTFVGGADLELGGAAAYWSPGAASLWFNADEQLYAVQVIGELADERAAAIATALAAELAGRL